MTEDSTTATYQNSPVVFQNIISDVKITPQLYKLYTNEQLDKENSRSKESGETENERPEKRSWN